MTIPATYLKAPHHPKNLLFCLLANLLVQTAVAQQPCMPPDTVKPVLTCKPYLQVNILQTGLVSLWHLDFLEQVSDNCTPPEQIKLAVSKERPPRTTFPRDPQTGAPASVVTYSCCDIGPQSVHLWAEDAAGNVSSCNIFLLIQDNASGCGGCANLDGFIKTEDGKGVRDAQIVFRNLGALQQTFPVWQPSDGAGYYSSSFAVHSSSTLQICPSLDKHPLNGVTTLDLALITKHVLGLTTLDSPYKYIAADANRSGTITTFDAVEFRKLILGLYDSLPNNHSWRFVDQAFVFPNPTDPFQTTAPFPECASRPNGYGHLYDVNFIGIKIGDVNNTTNPNFVGAAEDRGTDTLPIALADRMVLPGDVFEVRFQQAEPLIAQQFTVEHPGLVLLDILPESASIQLGHFGQFPHQKAISFAWNSEGAAENPAFRLRFRALAAGRLRQMLALSNRLTPSVAYRNTEAGEAGRASLALRFEASNADEKNAPFILYQNQPNPFQDATNIDFYLPQSGKVVLSVFDAAGKLLQRQENFFGKGHNQFAVDGLSAKGTLYYMVQTELAGQTLKMVRTE